MRYFNSFFVLFSLLLLGSSQEQYDIPKGYQIVQKQIYNEHTPTLINGRPALAGEYPEIVQIRTGNALCTATLIGPRVIITAAHCAETGETSRFAYDGQQYSAVITRSPLYPDPDHDLALGLLNSPISMRFANIGGTPGLSEDFILTGYGCTDSDGGGSDGVLRIGDSTVVGFDGYDFISKRIDGAALCFGDSGGPAYVDMDDPFVERHVFLGVNSKGNIIDTSLITRTDHPDSESFMRRWADGNNVEICGVNRNCDENPTDPPGCWKKFAKKLAILFEELSGCSRSNDSHPNQSQL